MNPASRDIRRALVTGAANGLGKSIALQLASDGYHVIAIDKDEAGLMRLHHDSIDSILGFHLDMSDRKSFQSSMHRIVSEGPYERVFLVAGISATGRFERIPRDAHEKLLGVNVLAPQMIATWLFQERQYTPGARVMFVSSISHRTGYPGAASYGASKDAIATYAKSIRKPFRKQGVIVCCTFPGAIRTDHADRHAPKSSDPKKRLPPSVAARKIIQAADYGILEHYPGRQSWAGRILGKAFPNATTSWMRKQIFEKLDKEVF